jgi:hypothetical protein
MIHPLFTQFNEVLGDRLNPGAPADDFADITASSLREAIGRRRSPRMGPPKIRAGYGEKVALRFTSPMSSSYVVGNAGGVSVSPSGTGPARWTDNAPDVMFTSQRNAPVRLGALRPPRKSVTSKPSTIFPYVPAAT